MNCMRVYQQLRQTPSNLLGKLPTSRHLSNIGLFCFIGLLAVCFCLICITRLISRNHFSVVCPFVHLSLSLSNTCVPWNTCIIPSLRREVIAVYRCISVYPSSCPSIDTRVLCRFFPLIWAVIYVYSLIVTLSVNSDIPVGWLTVELMPLFSDRHCIFHNSFVVACNSRSVGKYYPVVCPPTCPSCHSKRWHMKNGKFHCSFTETAPLCATECRCA